MRGSCQKVNVPKHMPDAVFTQASPISGTKYLLLEAKNVKLIAIIAQVTWTVQPDPLEVHITIDGETFTASQANPVSATFYEIALRPYVNQWMFMAPSDRSLKEISGYECRSLKIEVETTGGTVQSLDTRIKYEKW